MGRSTRRGPWLPAEDANLLHLVHIQGPNNWVRISQHMEHRSPKQCRERYHQNLKSSLNHEPISNDEGELIEQLVQEMGKRWAEIARRLGNRSDNAVKNWWNGSMNRRRRNTTHNTARAVGPRQLPVPATTLPRAESHYRSNPVYTPDSKSYASPNHLDTSSFHPSLPRLGHIPAGANPQSFRAEPQQRFSHPAVEASYANPPRPEFRGSLIGNLTLSAPGSLQGTPGTSFLRHLQPPLSTHGLRPPPLEHRPASHSDWQIPRLHDAPAISPAATEYSSVPSFHQAPSLISDNQSHYSISPKTISSPRPGMPALIDTSNQNWHAEQRRNSYIGYSHHGKIVQDEGYVSAIPASALNESVPENFPLDPSLRRSLSLPDPETKVDAGCQPASSPAEKDTRMNLSSLLG